jgi:hypothetical protein
LAAVCVSCRAGLAAEPSAERPLKYSRYFVPDQYKDWPLGDVKYIPIEEREFERLIEAADSVPLGRAGAKGGQVTSAAYRATLVDPDLLRGEARLQISRTGDQAVLISLAPLSLAISEPRWDDDTKATIGVRPSGKQALLVDRDGTLIFDWSLRGRRDSAGSLLFALELPASALGHLDLEVPASIVPSVADGVMVSGDDERRQGRWRFQLGGRTRVALKLDAKDPPARARRLTLLQEKTTCRLSPVGADIAVQLKLDVHREPLRRLQLDLPSFVRVVSVQYGGLEIPWLTSSGPSSGETTVAVDFPEPLLGSGRLVTVTALAPIKIGTAWKLPRLRVRDVTWQEGDMTLVVPATLALDALLPQGCRQTKVSPASAASSGESVELQLFSAEATAEVQVSRPRQQGRLASGTTIRFAPDAVRAEFRGRFESTEGEAYLLRAEVLSGWQIDSVTADRPGALANWSIDRSTRPSSLIVQLAEPISSSQPLELLVSGRRAPAPDGRYSGTTLRIVDFHGVAAPRRLLALETSVNQRLALEGGDPPRFEPRTALSDAERGLLASSLSDVYLQVDSDRADFQLVIEQQTPRYEGELHVTAQVVGRRLNESYRIRCQPDGSRVDQLLVALSEPREGDLRFHGDLSSGGDRPAADVPRADVTAERLSPEQQTARGLPNAGEVWLVRLPRELDQPFELQATRSLDFDAAVAPALASLPEAVSQQGLVEVRCEREAPLLESADRLEPVPPKAKTADSSTACAAFRYDPLEEIAGVPIQALVLRRRPDSDQPALATVWRLRLCSQFASPAESRHRAFFDLEVHGKPQYTMRLARGAQLVWALVDGKAADVASRGEELSLALPAQRRFVAAVVEFSLHGPSSNLARRCAAPWPTVELPVVSREWYVSTASQEEPLVWPEYSRGANLLGPLGRSRGDRPFDATKISDWRKMVSAQGGQLSEHRAERLLSVLGAALAGSDPPVASLGRLLAEAAGTQPSVFEPLRIDSQSLAALDLGPTSPLATDRGRTGDADPEALSSLAAQELRSQGLALVIDKEQLLLILTTRSTALKLAGTAFDDGRSLVFIRSQPPTADLAGDDTSYVPVSSWQRRPSSGWETGGGGEEGLLGDAATNQYRIQIDAADGGSLHLVRRDVVYACALAQVTIFAAVGVWVSRRRSILLSLVAGLAALAATWCPPAVAPLASGALVGCLVGATWRLFQPADRRARSRTALPLASAALVLLACGDSRADDSAETEKTPVPRVFIPVDAENKPGTTYQVPSDFLDELRRRASDAAAEPRGWLITGASYECALAGERPLGVREFTARYDVQVLAADARVRIPASRRQAALVFDSATLDGQPIELEWDEAGESLQCHVAEPGTYELEFRLHPVLADEQDLRGLQLVVPPVADSTLEVLLPSAPTSIDIPGIFGGTVVSDDGRRVVARLGPTGSLVVRWPLAAAAPPVADVEELLWLKVRPGSVVLDVKLNYNVTSGTLRQVEFAAERRLRLLPGAHTLKERTLPAEANTPDATQVTQLELEQPVSDQLSLNLSFLVTGTSGVGNIRLPRLQAAGARVSRRWLAVTVDAGLEYETRDAEQLEVLPAGDFAAKWGEADAATLRDALVYRLGSTETPWNLATRSREPQTTVKETLSLSALRTSALVRYEAQLMTTAGFVFQHRLLVPPELEVERITLEEEGADRVMRWARSEPGVVTLFLSRRVTGPQQLSLSGKLAVRANGRLSLPTITLDSGVKAAAVERAEVLERIVRLYRQPTVHVSLEDAAGLSELAEPATAQANPSLGRLVLSRLADKAYSGTVVISPNAPQLQQAVQLTLLRYVNQAWVVDVDYRFRADRGVVDSLSFDLPGSWAADVEVLSPPATIELSDQPGKSRKLLVVRPLKPLSGDCELKLRAPLKYRPGEPVTAPEIAPLNPTRTDRYWLLPQQVGLEAVTWDPQRMVAASLPEGLPAEAEGAAVFRAVGDHPQAVMSSVKAPVGVARVRLADIRLDYTPAQGWIAAAALDLEPGGQSACRVKLAEGWRLIYAGVGHAAVMPLAKGAGTWQVPLHSNRLPQRLELTLSHDGNPAPAPLQLPVAQLDGWPVEETLLTVSAPSNFQITTNAGQVDAGTCDEARLASAISLLDLPAEVIATTSTDDLAAWFRPWAEWLVSRDQRGALQRAAAGEPASAKPAGLPDNWLRLARRLHGEELLRRIDDQHRPTSGTLDLWQLVHDSSPATRFRWFAGDGPNEVTLRRGWPDGWPERWRQSAWIGLAVLGAAALPRFSVVADAVRRWPHFVGVTIGMLWWLYCEPSFLGWLLIAFSLAAALRSGFTPGWRDAAR